MGPTEISTTTLSGKFENIGRKQAEEDEATAEIPLEDTLFGRKTITAASELYKRYVTEILPLELAVYPKWRDEFRRLDGGQRV